MNSSPESRLLLVVAAKEPVPGKVKTRFTPQLSPQQAAALYGCMLEDKIRELSRLGGMDLALAYCPPEAGGFFAGLAPRRFQLFAQRGRDLGERMHNIFVDALGAGYQAVAIIGSDSPDLPGSLIQEAFRTLLAGRAAVVLGPTYDGGYYLVGMCRPHPLLFIDIPWSTATVLDVTLARARENAISIELLAAWYDLDTFADLVDFFKGSRQIKKNGGEPRAEKTLAFLSGLKNITSR